MKQYWTSTIVQNKEDKRAWCCAMHESVLSMEKALETIAFARGNFTVLSAWVDTYDEETGEKKTVFHECYVDVLGNVRKE